MKYRCLVLDHDDTAVDSTPTVHYPSFLESMGLLRVGMPKYSLEDFILKCFNPGFGPFCTDILKLTEAEIEAQTRIWRRHTESKVPDFFDGFVEMLEDFKSRGGIIAVVSHSESGRILRDYEFHSAPKPDIVFGWDSDPDKRKPSPYPLKEIMRVYGLKASELLMVDDLKPGLDMAKSVGVDFVAAGWAYDIPEIREYMRRESDYYFDSVRELGNLIGNA